MAEPGPVPRLPSRADVQAAAARLRGQVRHTPLLSARQIDDMAGAHLLCKAECLQETGSFKLRGALNRLLQLDAAQRSAGIVAFSSGNHAQGVARAARYLGLHATLVMPANAPEAKRAGVVMDGAELVSYDPATESREAIAAALADQRGAVLVPSFDDPDIIAGQGTVGLEIRTLLESRGEGLDHLICCAGGGGLISGISLALDGTGTQIWTAEPAGHDDWARSLQAGRQVRNPPGTRSICDAILTPSPGDLPWAVARSRLAGGLVVTDAQAQYAMQVAFRWLKVVLEPGGAVALAAALFALPEAARGRRVGVILSGGNVDSGVFAPALTISRP